MIAKDQYKLASRVIRARDRIRWLEDVFHYPVGFDCPCGGGYCENCEAEDHARAGYAKELAILREWMTLNESTIPGKYLEAAFKTRRSKFAIWTPDHKNGWYLARFAVSSYALQVFGLAHLWQNARQSETQRKWFEHQKKRCFEYFLPNIRKDIQIGYADFDRVVQVPW